jgi:hypothetical protein
MGDFGDESSSCTAIEVDESRRVVAIGVVRPVVVVLLAEWGLLDPLTRLGE